MLETVVLSIDSDRERISLGIKQYVEKNFDKLKKNKQRHPTTVCF